MPAALDATGQGVVLAAVIRSSLDCIIVVDDSGRVVEFNPAAERTFGYDRAFVLGKPIGDLIVPPHLRQAHAHGFERYLAGGEAHVLGRRVEIDGMRADGAIFPVELTITEVRAGGERLFTASLRDLSERREVERALRESEGRLAAFFDHVPSTMYLKDADGRFVMVNAEMGRRLRRAPAEIIGLQAADVVDAEIAARTEELERTVRESGRPVAVEQSYPLPDGSVIHTIVTRFPVRDPHGRVTHVGAMFYNLTPQKEAEQALARSREALHHSEKLSALGSLLAGVSHELNNPLSAVIGQTMMLEEDAEGTPFAARAQRIRVAAERCARIVETFLAMARRKPPDRTAVHINQVVRSALELLAYGLRASGIATIFDLAEGLPPIAADADQLHQVVMNLVVNAQQALEGRPEPRRLRLATRLDAAGGAIELEVADNGPGVPAADARRIFEPFFTTKPTGVGTGIGLSFSLGVVEAHGGRLRLREGGGGASFVVELPVDPAAAVPPPAAMAPARSSERRGAALVVDDDAGVAEALGEFVAREGYDVEIADGGAAAVELLRAKDYELVLADLRMPGIDGAALFAWIVAERPALASRVGFVTGDVLSEASAEFLARAGRPHIAKPFTPDGVRRLIAEAVGAAGPTG